MCFNLVGSFQCFCNAGFVLASDSLNCNGKNILPSHVHALRQCIVQDVDECDTGNGGCEQTCTNNDGSFQCFCNQGFELASDGFSCDSTFTTLGGNYVRLILF